MAKTKFISGTQTKNGLEYLDTLNKQLRNKPRELTKKQQQQIIQVYRDAYMDIINRNIKGAYGDNKAVKNLTAAYSQQIYDELQKVVKEYNSQAASQIADINKQMMQLLMGDGYQQIKDQVDKLVDIVNKDTVEQLIRGKVYEDGKGLDKRLWKSVSASGKKIEDAVTSCTAEGMGAADMAQNLKEFAMGGHHTWSRNKIREKLGSGYARKYSGGLDYESLRLARTTITHQAQIETINTKRVNPYMGGIKWHSNHEAGRTCDLCNERDGHIFITDKEDVPLDHPNGACWLEPVWMINGKEATPEDIAKDMKAWANGEPNSGAMDKIPEYKGLGGTKQPVKKTIKKTTKAQTTKKTQPPKGEFSKLTNTQIDEYIGRFTKDVHKRGNIKYIEDAGEVLKNYPKHIQQAYYLAGKHAKGFEETNSTKAFYRRTDNKIHMDGIKMTEQANSYKYNKFITWFHESGHMMDDLLQIDKDGFRSNSKPLSANDDFIKALKKDFTATKKRIDTKYMNMSGLTKEEFKLRYSYATAKNRLYKDMLYDELAKDNNTKGIQDIIEGLSNASIRIRWGHGKRYWNRNNRNEEVASEAWAHICAAYCDKESLEMMEKYFPTAMEEFNKIIKNRLKELK